jgi:hypothetical protein
VLSPLPDRAVTRPWRLGTVAEVSPAELRGPLWTRPHRGVAAWFGLDADAPLARVEAAAEAARDLPLGTWAAAFVLGATDVDGVALDGETHLPVVFCPGTSGARRRRPGLEPLRSPLDADDVTQARGIAVTAAARTAFDLGRTAPDLDTAVADVDALLRATGLTVPALEEYAARRPGWKGVPLLRAALPLLDPRSRSRPESRMRVVWVRDAGLPRPQVNVPVLGDHGWTLGEPDLLDVDSGLVAEYDGSHHRRLRQHGADNVREETFERVRMTVVRATWPDVLERRGLARRLRVGHATARQMPRGAWYVPPSALAR